MDKLYKYIIYQIAINIEAEHLLNFFLTKKKFNELSKDEYFWKLKRLKDYPNVDYQDDLNLTERYKFINTYNCGYAYDINDKSRFPLSDQNLLVKKIFSDNNSYGHMYILTYDAKLYMCGYFNYKNITTPELIANNIYDFYCDYFGNLALLDEDGNIKDRVSNFIWKQGNAKKFGFLYKDNCIISENIRYYVLTHEGNMYIQNNIYMMGVKDFKMDHSMLYCLKYNKELWCVNTKNSEIEPIMIETNVRKFKITERDVFYLKYNKELWCLLNVKIKTMILPNVTSFGFANYPVDFILIANTDKYLFKLYCESLELIQIDNNVDFVFQNDDLFYVKNRINLFQIDEDDNSKLINLNINSFKRIKYAIFNNEISRDIVVVNF